MKNLPTLLLMALMIAAFGLSARAEDAAPAPLKVLLVDGGGYHDYGKQGPFLAQMFQERVNCKVTVVDGGKDAHAVPELFSDDKFADGYDVVVYDLCYATDGKADPKQYEKIFDVTKAGKPAVLLHCAMHCFRPAKDWAEYAGMRTNHHESFGPFSVRPADVKNAITQGWPADWKTAGDEQYVTEEVYPDTTKLLISTGVAEKAKHPENVVAWSHTFGKGRVFGCTLGHDMHTIADPHYLQLIANGLLWSVDKLDDKGTAKPGFAGVGPKADAEKK